MFSFFYIRDSISKSQTTFICKTTLISEAMIINQYQNPFELAIRITSKLTLISFSSVE